jgi:hypothetical protein
LEYIDVDKGAIWYASAQADGGDIYVPLVDVLFPDNINDIFIKTNEKINLLEYQDTALYDNFVEIYSSDPEALNDPDFTNLSLNQYAQAKKLNIFGAPHVYGGTELIQTRLNYYWQYYDYILHSDNDYSNCWN